MKYLLLLFIFVNVTEKISATSLPRYKVHIVTWDKNRATGYLNAISDSGIAIKLNNGKILTFSPSQTKSLKIWKPGINLPMTLLGSASLTFIFVTSVPKDDGLGRFVAYLLGIPLGTIAGLISGDLISTKYNGRQMRVTDFKLVNSNLEIKRNKPIG